MFYFYFLLGIHAFLFDYKSTTNGVEGGYMLFTVSQVAVNFIPLE
jgi:hypothetical protein